MTSPKPFQKRIWILLCITSLILVSGKFTHAQTKFSFETITTKDGLPDNEVNQVIQDHSGFIWMATAAGLSRFDGYQYLHFNTSSSPSLRHNEISSIALKGDSIWIAHKVGIDIISLSDFTISVFPISIIENEWIEGLFADNVGAVWFYTQTGRLFRSIHQQTRLVQNVQPVHEWLKTKNNSVVAIGEYNQQVWWSRLDGNLFTYNASNNQTRLYYQGDSLKAKGPSIIDAQGNLWHVSNRYFLALNDKLQPIFKHKSEGLPISMQGRASVYWIDTQKRLWLSDLFGNTVMIPPHCRSASDIVEAPNKLSSVNHLFIDQSNVLWISTQKGLAKSLVRNVFIKHYFQSNEEFKGASIRGVIEDKESRIWVGSYEGLFEIDAQHQQATLKIPPSYNQEQFVFFDLLNDDDKIWIATEGRGLFSFDKRSEALIDHNKNNPKFHSQRYFTALLKDDRGDLWIGAYEGLFHYSQQSQLITEFKNPDGTAPLNGVRVFDMIEDAEGFIWLGTQKGLFKLDLSTQLLITHNKVAKDNIIQVLHLDEKNNIWIGTKGQGLIYYQPANQKIQQFTISQGLAENTINGILESHQGTHLWISTNNGLSRLNIDKQSIKNFYTEDGFTDNEFNQKAFLKSRDGTLWFGGINGLNAFKAESFDTDAQHPQVVLSAFSKFDGELDSLVHTAIGQVQAHEIHLAHNDRFVSFNFALANYEKPEKNQFAYMIEGLHEDWHTLGNQHQLVFNNLGAGSYVLKIKGADSHGEWSNNELKIDIHIERAFYQNWWFIILCFLLIASLAWIGHKIRLAQLLKLERLRTRIARDLHDELGSSLTSIGIYSELAKEQMDVMKNEKNLDEIAALSREASTTLRDIVWAIDTTDDHLKSVLERLRSHMHQMLGVTGVKCELLEYNLNPELVLPSFVKHNIYLIFKEGINNISRHTEATHVMLKVEKDLESLTIELVDNGKPKSDPNVVSGGNGLRNMSKRAEAMGAKLSFRNQNGFSICLNLPLKSLMMKA